MSTIKPAEFKTSWTEAETAMFSKLCADTKEAEGRSAFLGVNPGILNAWAINLRPVDGDAEQALFVTEKRAMAFQYWMEFRYTSRKALQEKIMMTLAGSPAKDIDNTNIHLLRVRDMSEIETTDIVPANQTKTVRVFTVRLTIDLVFNTNV